MQPNELMIVLYAADFTKLNTVFWRSNFMAVNQALTMNSVLKISLVCATFSLSLNAKSQSNYLGSWNVANAELYLNKKWSIWSEVQTRSQKLFADFFYHELKAGVNYKPGNNYAVLIGMGQYVTYSNGGNFKSPVLSHEFRLWEQLTLVNNMERLKIEHRYRIEQRWRNGQYFNRFRYRLNPIIPLLPWKKKTIEPGTLYTSIYDEIFLGDRAPHFERNRLFAGLGYQFNNALTLQFGWLRQYDYSLAGSSAKEFLQSSLFFKINQSKTGKKETHPSPMD